MTQCCNNQLYNSDQYCPVCGRQAKHTNIIESAFDINPTINASFNGKGDHFTGQIVDAYHYKRIKSGIGKAFIWVILEDTNEKIREFNIDGELTKFKNIQKGDILSVMSAQETTLSDPIPSDKKNIVKNNSVPGIVTYHRTDNTTYSSVDSSISMPKDAFPSAFSCLFLATAAIVFSWYLYAKQQVSPNNPWFVGAGALSIICLLLACRSLRVNKKKAVRAQAAAKTINKLDNIIYSAIGYANLQRPYSNAITRCSSCNQIIHSHDKYCTECGTPVSDERSTTPKINKSRGDRFSRRLPRRTSHHE